MRIAHAGLGVWRCAPRRRTILGCAAVLACLLLTGVLVAAVPVLALPPGRHYEMVSPVFKGGYGVRTIEAASPTDGDSVAYSSLGAFAGAPSDLLGELTGSTYVARRTASGWSTVPLMLPATLAPFSNLYNPDFSANFEESLLLGYVGSNEGSAQFEPTGEELLLHPTDAGTTGFEVAGNEVFKTPVLSYTGGSADLSHLTVEAREGRVLTLEAAGTHFARAPYDLVSHGGGEHPLRFIGLNNDSAEPKPVEPKCEAVDLGAAQDSKGGKQSTFNAIADDGREMFFWTCTGSGSVETQQLFVRLDGVRTLEISRPLQGGEFGGCVGAGDGVPGEVPCQGAGSRAPAEFAGASADGSRVFFTTAAPLVGEDKNAGNDLYMASIGCPEVEPGCEVAKREVTSLVQVSHDPTPGEAAEVQGVVAIAPDGSHVYFAARGVLSEGSNAEGNAPVKGADNLYVYERDERYPDGHVAFIADLCSHDVLSGEKADVHCPANLDSPHDGQTTVSDEDLWRQPAAEVQTAGEGRFLVFSSYGQLTSDDTDNARDVYRYDSQSGSLERVSVGEAGFHADGNGEDEACEGNADAHINSPDLSNAMSVETADLPARAVTEDGSRIVFESGEPLSPDATNGLVNAYEWHEGAVSLVSSGSDQQAVGVRSIAGGGVTITPSGSDVFFITVQKLLPRDADDAPDLYDARMGSESGFPVAPAAREECSGDACQGALTNPAPLLVPGSVSQEAGGNFPALAAPLVPAAQTKAKAKAKPVKCKKGFVKKKGKCVRKPKARGARNHRRAG